MSFSRLYNLAMFRLPPRRISSEHGAATIEALGTMVVLLLGLLLALVIGVSFYNLSILNSAAQNITLNTQVQIDRFCSPNQSGNDCTTGINRAISMRDQVMTQADQSLAFSDPIECQVNAAPCGSAFASLNASRPQTTPVVLPSAPPVNGVGLQAMPAGWGYNSIELSTRQQLLGAGANSLLPGLGGGLSLGARALTTSYKDPTR